MQPVPLTRAPEPAHRRALEWLLAIALALTLTLPAADARGQPRRGGGARAIDVPATDARGREPRAEQERRSVSGGASTVAAPPSRGREVREPTQATPAPEVTTLRRPYVRNAVRATAEAQAPRTADGRFIDPNTLKPIEGKYDLGHRPGSEFWRERDKAQAEGLDQKRFNDRMNDPRLYQIEDPRSNRSHRYEQARETTTPLPPKSPGP